MEPQPIIIPLLITQVGLNAIRNADNSGISLSLAEIAVGEGQYVPNANRTALDIERERVGINITRAVGLEQLDLQFLISSNLAYFVSEVGVYLVDGTLFAVWSDPINNLTYKAANSIANNSLLVTIQLLTSALPPDVPLNVIVTPIDEALFVTQASSENMGLVRFAKNGTNEIIDSTTTVMNPVQIQQEITTRVTAEQIARDSSIADAIAAEVTDRNTAITNQINTEITARNNAIQSAVTAEANARTTAITNSMANAGNIIGEIKLLPKTSIMPNTFLVADGALVKQADYTEIFSIINHRYQEFLWSDSAYPYTPSGWDIGTMTRLTDDILAFSTDRNDANNTERFYVSNDDGTTWVEPSGYVNLGVSWGNFVTSMQFANNQLAAYSSISKKIVGSNDFVEYFKFPSTGVQNGTLLYSSFSNKWLVMGDDSVNGQIESFSPTDRFETKGACDVVATNITLSRIRCAIEYNGRLFALTNPLNTSLYIYSSDDGGSTWIERYNAAISIGYFNAVAAGGGYLVAVGYSGRTHISSDNGNDWSLLPLPNNYNDILTNVIFTGTLFVAVGTTGRLFTYIPGDSTWVLKNTFSGNVYLRTLCSTLTGDLLLSTHTTNRIHKAVGAYDRNTYFQLPDYENFGSAELIYTVRVK